MCELLRYDEKGIRMVSKLDTIILLKSLTLLYSMFMGSKWAKKKSQKNHTKFYSLRYFYIDMS